MTTTNRQVNRISKQICQSPTSVWTSQCGPSHAHIYIRSQLKATFSSPGSTFVTHQSISKLSSPGRVVLHQSISKLISAFKSVWKDSASLSSTLAGSFHAGVPRDSKDSGLGAGTVMRNVHMGLTTCTGMASSARLPCICSEPKVLATQIIKFHAIEAIHPWRCGSP